MAMGNKSGRLVREAAKVQSAGRDGDTVLAHINPREAQMLRQAGGRGTRNPETGLMEFANESNFDAAFYLAQNPDVAAAGVDPWQHYQQQGQNEGRVATQQELAARAEGYTGLFGRPESGQNYVDWKNSQSASTDLGPNNALNDYLRSQLPDVEPNFDGQGGFWAAAERAGYPRHFIEGLISGFTQNFDPRTGAALRPEAEGFYNGSALAPHSTYDADGRHREPYRIPGGGISPFADWPGGYRRAPGGGGIRDFVRTPGVDPLMGGSVYQGTPGVSSSPGVRPMRQMQWSRTAADQYLPRAQQQGMATYGSDGLGAADFGLSKRYVVPLIYDFTDGSYEISDGNRTIGRAHGGPVHGPGTETSDSVPARLSDGEFVFTAEAVRGVGEGSRHAGAQRLYAAMKDMERRARR